MTQAPRLVAITSHGLTIAMSGAFWYVARRFRATELWNYGNALPGLTQILYDFEVPGLICGLLLTSLIVAVMLRNSTAALVVSALSATVGALAIAVCWLVMRLPMT